LFISIHQWPQYPGSGRTSETGGKNGKGFTMNLPFPSGASDADYAAAMERAVRPISEEFEPEMVLVSAGFDAHERDPLGGMRLTSNGFAHMAECIKDIAKGTGRGPCYVLEGGYHLDAVAKSVSKTIQATLGTKSLPIAGIPSAACLKIIDEALAAR
jgi:acetoin utilization deacetylase AcuC-like enzyme